MKIQKYVNGHKVNDSEIDSLSLDYDIYKKALNSVRSRMENKGSGAFAEDKTPQDNLTQTPHAASGVSVSEVNGNAAI